MSRLKDKIAAWIVAQATNIIESYELKIKVVDGDVVVWLTDTEGDGDDVGPLSIGGTVKSFQPPGE